MEERIMKRLNQMVLFLCMLLFAAPSMAAVYTFGDIFNEWPGHSTPKSNIDAYGNPQILGASVTTDANGFLKEIDIRFLAEQGIGLLYGGDFNSLFINSSWTGSESYENWDYYIFGAFPGIFNEGPIIDDFSAFATNAYHLTSPWSYTTPTGDARIGHPNGIAVGANASDPNLIDHVTLPNKSDITTGNQNPIEIQYVFKDGQILLGDNFVIGYTPYCANDVFLAAVPEPSAFLLLSAGLVFCAGRLRRLNR
jgi:hypothetical protein